MRGLPGTFLRPADRMSGQLEQKEAQEAALCSFVRRIKSLET